LTYGTCYRSDNGYRYLEIYQRVKRFLGEKFFILVIIWQGELFKTGSIDHGDEIAVGRLGHPVFRDKEKDASFL